MTDGEEYKLCAEGSGECEPVTRADFDKIKKLYGIKEELTDIFPSERVYNN